jgi:hypothetical protein
MCVTIQEQRITPEEELRIKILKFAPDDIAVKFFPDHFGLVDRQFNTSSIIGVAKRFVQSKVWGCDIADFVVEPYLKLVIEQDFEVVCYFFKSFMICASREQKDWMCRSKSFTKLIKRQNEFLDWVEKTKDLDWDKILGIEKTSPK